MLLLHTKKQGWVRILESIISILILLGLFTFFISNQVKPFSSAPVFSDLGQSLLQELTQNVSLVNNIAGCCTADNCDIDCPALNTAKSIVEAQLEQMKMTNIGFNLSLSKSDKVIVPILPQDTDVYAESQVIGSSRVKLIVYLWQKK